MKTSLVEILHNVKKNKIIFILMLFERVQTQGTLVCTLRKYYCDVDFVFYETLVLSPHICDLNCCVSDATQYKHWLYKLLPRYQSSLVLQRWCTSTVSYCVSEEQYVKNLKKPGICCIIFCWEAQAQFTYIRRCRGREYLALFSLLVELTMAELLRRGRKVAKREV